VGPRAGLDGRKTASNSNSNIIVIGNGLNEQTLSPLSVGLLYLTTLDLSNHISNAKATGCPSPRRNICNHLSQFCAEVQVWNINSTHPYVSVAWRYN
jgi:hypothetical protein